MSRSRASVPAVLRAARRGPVDFSTFVSVDGHDPQGVSVRKASSSASTASSTASAIEVQRARRAAVRRRRSSRKDDRDRRLTSPTASRSCGSTGRAYVLPSRGQQGIPVVTVNTDEVEIEVYRIGDRIARRRRCRTATSSASLASCDLERSSRASGEQVYDRRRWTSPQQLNEEVTTAFPVSEAIGTLKPGVYAMTAKPAQVVTGE